MASKSCATPYYFAASAEDKLSSSLQARWDPNAPGCFGVSQDAQAVLSLSFQT